ncbi:MAG: hypothetical protein ABSD96_22980 [Candidatus Korobacteraceae bacterium]|jgi:hypothetical protein
MNKPKPTQIQAAAIRKAANDNIRDLEFARMREAYAQQPDSAAEADDWSSAEEFQP